MTNPRRREPAALVLLSCLAFAACAHGKDDREPPPPSARVDDQPDHAAAVVERGPKQIAIDGDPNGLLWDASANALLIADGDHNRILRWTDARGIEEHVRLPGEPSEGRGPGQLVRLADGALVVTRFGDGDSGGVVSIAPDGRATPVPGLDPSHRRIGLAVAPDGTLFTAWFGKHGNARIGAVAKFSVTGGETVVIEGLQKPVGLLVRDNALIVADQRLGRILRAPLDDLAHTETLVESIEDPDLLTAGPDGSLLTGGKNGKVRRIDADGTVSDVADGFSSVRGVAYDPAHARIFIAEHDGDDSDGLHHALHIRPLDG